MLRFTDQVEDRRKTDQQRLDDSYAKVAGVVMGKHTAKRIFDERILTQNALDEILKYYHYRPIPLPEDSRSTEEQLDVCLRPHGLMWRRVELTKNWYKDAFGPILAYQKESGIPTAMLPGRIAGYYYFDYEIGITRKLNAITWKKFDAEAICFYRPLPQKKLGTRDLLRYIMQCLTLTDAVLLVLAALAVTLIGMLLPRLTRDLTGPILTGKDVNALIGTFICMVCVLISSQLITCIKGLVTKKMVTKASLGIQSSMMMRLLSLPAVFFREYSAGDMKTRVSAVDQLSPLLLDTVVSAGLSSVMSFLYFVQIFRYTPSLGVAALLIFLFSIEFSAALAVSQSRISRFRMEAEAKESGMSYAMITGMEKIRLSGAEKRFFAKWLDLYAEEADITYDPPVFLKLHNIISVEISLLSNIVLYYLAIRNGVEPSAFFAFAAAYGMVSGGVVALSRSLLSAARIRPILEMTKPFLEAEPENVESNEIVTSISGGIELENVSFRYGKREPYVLNDLSLSVKPGEYVAITGRTGCGKSTFLRLLLGFETPERGSIYYDGKDIRNLNLSSLHKQIGTVMQSSGLFEGDIYSNIVISAPELTLKDAWKAAEIAGISDDIRAMPMGMHTFISEGRGGISGGQKQRIMIARAIVNKPKLLLFDEATSALDNRTQRQISEALDAMGCTRIVIAHRLSTIRNCDRILVLDGGRIVEDGTYEELIGKEGVFASLVSRQRQGHTEEK